MCQISGREEDKATFFTCIFFKIVGYNFSQTVKRMYISEIEVRKNKTALLIETEVDHFLQGVSV